MRLKELFDKPTEWDWTDKQSNLYVAEFVIENTKEYRVEISEEFQDDWIVVFELYYGDNVKSYQNITGSGDEIKVFSTVMQIIEEFIKEKHPQKISLIAKEKSRVSLYQKMINRYAKRLGYKLFHHTEGYGIGDLFGLERI